MNRTPEEISQALKIVYADNLIKYNISNIKPHPASLLALLLLADVTNYEKKSPNLETFYISNKEKILKQIKKVIQDFNFKEVELLLYNKNPIIKDDDFNLIQVFSSAVKALYYACNKKEENPIIIYNNFSINWGGEHILEAYLKGDLSKEEPLDLLVKKKKKDK